ncbi:energy transducer TonB [Montanilutibacter psychrotolerans]|nr:energy transducer TonB [Lysobacter psychrotolerans]
MNATSGTHFNTGRAGVGALVLIGLLVACHPQQEGPAPIRHTEPTVLDAPAPNYPLALACEGTGGYVELMLTIGVDGRASAFRLTRSSKLDALDQAAQEAVRGWKFKPATRGGKPVSTQIKVPITFTPPAVRPTSCFALDEAAKADG